MYPEQRFTVLWRSQVFTEAPAQPGMSGNWASTRMRKPGAQTTPFKEALTPDANPALFQPWAWAPSWNDVS